MCVTFSLLTPSISLFFFFLQRPQRCQFQLKATGNPKITKFMKFMKYAQIKLIKKKRKTLLKTPHLTFLPIYSSDLHVWPIWLELHAPKKSKKFKIWNKNFVEDMTSCVLVTNLFNFPSLIESISIKKKALKNSIFEKMKSTHQSCVFYKWFIYSISMFNRGD